MVYPLSMLIFSRKLTFYPQRSFPRAVSLKKPKKTTVNRNMRIFKYLVGIWAAIAVYALFSFIAGPKGISAYNFLLSEKEQQKENIRNLELLNEELERSKNNLIYDHDTLLVQAHQMGYGYENERFIRIVGLSGKKPIPAEVGNVYSARSPDFIVDRFIKISAFCLGLLLFAFLLTMEVIDRRSRD